MNVPASNDWNELVPIANRLESPNKNARRPADLTPTHIVIHITGTNSLSATKSTFLAPSSTSAHYLVGSTGELFQFVRDSGRAWHAGIAANSRALYARKAEVWSRYLRYYDWYKGYPDDAVFVDGNLAPVSGGVTPTFVARADGSAWPEFDYFFSRWPGADLPVNFAADPDPNNYAIGIETLGFGSKKSDPNVYTDAMYKKLGELTRNLSAKYNIPCVKGRIVGHEDVAPVERFGWDPNTGFDWSAVH